MNWKESHFNGWTLINNRHFCHKSRIWSGFLGIEKNSDHWCFRRSAPSVFTSLVKQREQMVFMTTTPPADSLSKQIHLVHQQKCLQRIFRNLSAPRGWCKKKWQYPTPKPLGSREVPQLFYWVVGAHEELGGFKVAKASKAPFTKRIREFKTLTMTRFFCHFIPHNKKTSVPDCVLPTFYMQVEQLNQLKTAIQTETDSSRPFA